MTRKTDPSRVNPTLARQALAQAEKRTHVWSQYIILHFRATGDLAPGCDAKDLYAWLEANMPQELAAITMGREKERTHAEG